MRHYDTPKYISRHLYHYFPSKIYCILRSHLVRPLSDILGCHETFDWRRLSPLQIDFCENIYLLAISVKVHYYSRCVQDHSSGSDIDVIPNRYRYVQGKFRTCELRFFLQSRKGLATYYIAPTQ